MQLCSTPDESSAQIGEESNCDIELPLLPKECLRCRHSDVDKSEDSLLVCDGPLTTKVLAAMEACTAQKQHSLRQIGIVTRRNPP